MKLTGRIWIAFAATWMFLGASYAAEVTVVTGIETASLRDVKRTPQEKYLTSDEAFVLLEENPDILLIDVRDPVEVQIYGHPEPVDAIVPVRVQSTTFNEVLLEWELKDNPHFLSDMEEALKAFGKTKADRIIITCGSGWRSALAATRLFEAGYTDVWHIPDGYEGEEKAGFNSANAWQLRGLPWSFERVHGSRRLRVVK